MAMKNVFGEDVASQEAVRLQRETLARHVAHVEWLRAATFWQKCWYVLTGEKLGEPTTHDKV